MPVRLSHIDFIQQVAIVFIYGHGSKGTLIVGVGGDGRSPRLNNAEQVEICSGKRAVALNELALTEEFPTD